MRIGVVGLCKGSFLFLELLQWKEEPEEYIIPKTGVMLLRANIVACNFFFRDIVLPVCFESLTLYDRTLQNQLVQELMGARSSVVKQESLAHYRSYRAYSPQVVRFRAQ